LHLLFKQFNMASQEQISIAQYLNRFRRKADHCLRIARGDISHLWQSGTLG
jgi:hypothetical protein